jgi:hypothetical protein
MFQVLFSASMLQELFMSFVYEFNDEASDTSLKILELSTVSLRFNEVHRSIRKTDQSDNSIDDNGFYEFSQLL